MSFQAGLSRYFAGAPPVDLAAGPAKKRKKPASAKATDDGTPAANTPAETKATDATKAKAKAKAKGKKKKKISFV